MKAQSLFSQVCRYIYSLIKRSVELYAAEYPLKVQGVYYHRWTRMNILLIQVQGKRIAYHMPMHMILKDKSLIESMSPIDSCIIGILANNEHHGIVEDQTSSYKNMKRIQHTQAFQSIDHLLKVVRSYTTETGNTVCVLASRFVEKEMHIPVDSLYRNYALLSALQHTDAMKIGYDISEEYQRKFFDQPPGEGRFV